MASEKTRWAGNKLKHIGRNVVDKAIKFGKIGVGVGIGLGLVTALVAGGGLIGSMLLGAVCFGILGLKVGAAWGALKGVLSRPEPSMDEIMADAAECSHNEPQQAQGHAPAPAVAPSFAPGFAPAGSAPSAPSPQIQQAAASAGRTDEIRALTSALEQSRSEAPAQAPAGSWQDRVTQQQAAQGADRVR